MPLINCEANLFQTWYVNHVLVFVANQVPTLATTDTKLYVLVVTFSNQDNEKLLEQLKSGFKRTINWNKYKSKITTRNKNSTYFVTCQGDNYTASCF